MQSASVTPLREYPLTRLAPTLAQLLGIPAPAAAQEPPLAEIITDWQALLRVAVLAPDALGHYPLTLWRHELPYLSSLHETKSLLLRAIMPTITPVNFSCMVTGAEQRVHGIQTFNDSFSCETLFDVIRARGGRSAGVGQKGYTGGELLGRFADLWGRAESNTDAEVESIALSFAREQLPQFLIVQLGSTDDVFHKYGPSSPEVVPVLRETDGRLERMVGELTGLGYGVIVTADHGQHDATTESKRGGTHGTEADEDALVPCTWVAPQG